MHSIARVVFNTRVVHASFSTSIKFGPDGSVDSHTTYSVWLVGFGDRYIQLKTGEEFRAPLFKNGEPQLAPTDIRLGLDIFPASRPVEVGVATNYVAYDGEYGSGSGHVRSWIGGDLRLPDTAFADLLENARHGNYPRYMKIRTEGAPFLRYVGDDTVSWDNVSDPDNRFLSVSDVDYSFILLGE